VIAAKEIRFWTRRNVFIEEVVQAKIWNRLFKTWKENQNEKDFSANNNSLYAPAQRS